MAKSNRQFRVADLIHQNLALLLKRAVFDPRLSKALITGVDISPDLKQARVFFTVLNGEDLEDVKKAFKKATGYFRRLLAQATELRHIPQLNFVYDNSVERGDKISRLIQEAFDSDVDQNNE